MLIMKELLDMEYNEEEGVFKTHCKCYGKICELAMTNGVFTNFISMEVIEKLHIPRTTLKKPYRVQGWNEKNIVEITKKACIPFRIGAHEVVLWFDIFLKMECHLILGRK